MSPDGANISQLSLVDDRTPHSFLTMIVVLKKIAPSFTIDISQHIHYCQLSCINNQLSPLHGLQTFSWLDNMLLINLFIWFDGDLYMGNYRIIIGY